MFDVLPTGCLTSSNGIIVLVFRERSHFNLQRGWRTLMSLKSFACTVAACCLLAAPAFAQPSLSINLVNNMGAPTLDANGNWQWQLVADPDDTFYALPGNLGNSVAIEGGLTLAGSNYVSSTLGANFDQANPGQPIFGTETISADIGLPEGLQAIDNNIFFAYGSNLLPSDAPVTALTVIANGPATDAMFGTTTTTLSLLGVLGTGAQASISQTTAAGPPATSTSAFYDMTVSYTATPGDANLSGGVATGDLAILAGAFGSTGASWATGDFNGDGSVGTADLAILAGNFGAASGTISASLALSGSTVAIGMIMVGLAFAARRYTTR
jgi:hypothetical protein